MEPKDRVVVFISHAHEEAKLALILKEHITRDFLGLVKESLVQRIGETSMRELTGLMC